MQVFWLIIVCDAFGQRLIDARNIAVKNGTNRELLMDCRGVFALLAIAWVFQTPKFDRTKSLNYNALLRNCTFRHQGLGLSGHQLDECESEVFGLAAVNGRQRSR